MDEQRIERGQWRITPDGSEPYHLWQELAPEPEDGADDDRWTDVGEGFSRESAGDLARVAAEAAGLRVVGPPDQARIRQRLSEAIGNAIDSAYYAGLRENELQYRAYVIEHTLLRLTAAPGEA